MMPLFPSEFAETAVSVGTGVSRATEVYNVHAYHTKVPVEAITPFILKYTNVGDTVMDPFCGSGMTGVAARRHGRVALLSDLSPAAVHIARNYTTPCDPVAYSKAVARVYAETEGERSGLYTTKCHLCMSPATTAYLVWSDMRRCPQCAAEIRLWDQRASGLRRITCPACHATFRKNAGHLVSEVPVSVSFDCPVHGRLDRDPLEVDIRAAAVARNDIPYWIPEVVFGPDREMWRSGHADLGIYTVADFYSPRNLRALGALWSAINRETDSRVRSALQFTFTAIANRASRRYQWNAKRPTNVLGSTLYVSSLRYEFNVFGLWRRKVAAIQRFFTSTAGFGPSAAVTQASATALPYDAGCIDYCFTDPPFGANIIYSDSSLLWEAWLGDLTDKTREAVMNNRGKGLDQYADLMRASFGEVYRVLKQGAAATVVFQNTDAMVWEALLAAAVDAGFSIVNVDVMHKVQPSFKGVKAQEEGERGAASDVVLTLRRDRPVATVMPMMSVDPIWQAVREELLRPNLSKRQRSSGHLYAVAVAAAIKANIPASHATFDALESLLAQNCRWADGGWHLAEANYGI